MLPVSVLLILASFFCKSGIARWTLLLSALPALVSVVGMFVSFGLFAWLGCTGSVLDQHVCSPGAMETMRYEIMRPAVLLWFYGTFAAVGVAIVGGIIASAAEFAKRTGIVR